MLISMKQHMKYSPRTVKSRRWSGLPEPRCIRRCRLSRRWTGGPRGPRRGWGLACPRWRTASSLKDGLEGEPRFQVKKVKVFLSELLSSLRLFKMGQSRLFLFIFVRFTFQSKWQIDNLNYINVVLEIRTRGRRMVGADNSHGVWRPPYPSLCLIPLSLITEERGLTHYNSWYCL